MDFFDRLLKYIGVSAVLSWLRRRRKVPDFEEEQQMDWGFQEKQEVVRPDGKLPWVPHGFTDPFNPYAHHALPEIQKRAVFALFDHLGLTWVPGEYFDILGRYPNPIAALQKFCEEFKLDIQKIRYMDPTEVKGLHQCVGILVELDVLKHDIMQDHRHKILSLMRKGAYYYAEHYLDSIRLTNAILTESEDLSQRIVFPQYQDFIEYIRGLAKDPLSLGEEEIEDIRCVNRTFLEHQERFDHVIGVLNGEVAWMYEYWPENDWGNANLDTRDGLVIEKERVESFLKTGEPDVDFDIDDDDEEPDIIGIAITYLEDEILAFLRQFIDEIQRSHGGGAWQEPDKAYLKSRMQSWLKALGDLGFLSDAEPTKAEIKSAYRKMAMAYHPDRHMNKPEAEQVRFKELFQEIDEARKILENGKPEAD